MVLDTTCLMRSTVLRGQLEGLIKNSTALAFRATRKCWNETTGITARKRSILIIKMTLLSLETLETAATSMFIVICSENDPAGEEASKYRTTCSTTYSDVLYSTVGVYWEVRSIHRMYCVGLRACLYVD